MRIAACFLLASTFAAGCCCPMMKPPAKSAADEEAEIRKVMASSWWAKPLTQNQANTLVAELMNTEPSWIFFMDKDGQFQRHPVDHMVVRNREGKTIFVAPGNMDGPLKHITVSDRHSRFTAARDLAKAVGP